MLCVEVFNFVICKNMVILNIEFKYIKILISCIEFKVS